jgi:hypothetical protein
MGYGGEAVPSKTTANRPSTLFAHRSRNLATGRKECPKSRKIVHRRLSLRESADVPSDRAGFQFFSPTPPPAHFRGAEGDYEPSNVEGCASRVTFGNTCGA